MSIRFVLLAQQYAAVGRIRGEPKMLPARLPGLTRMATVVIASTSPSTAAKPLSTTSGPVGFGLRFVNLQRASAQFGSVQCRNRFVSFTGVSHFHKRETPRASGFSVGDDVDFLDRTVCFEDCA
jgi:hypothetical protein